MKIKQLEITGFKSFREKTGIHFPDGISAVVGPNGCGKSNVFDALRWVMGEQSVKQLRGKAMEDIIFGGTRDYLASNLAEVSLTLSNTAGVAPEEYKDFTEIRLTRRLYRSGESAYLINRQPCRLKDIYHLFLGSGMGSRSYTVIQQGNIGAITDADPQERRVYIEEAAGTTRYKARKAEALRKIESTQQDMLRLADIISEIKRQMNNLQRQAEKAERYRRYQNRIRRLDITLKVRRTESLTARLTELHKLLQTLQTGDEEQIKRLHQLDAEIEAIRLARLEKDQALARQRQIRHELQRAIDRLESDQVHLQQEVTRLDQEVRELTESRKLLEAKNDQIASEIQTLEQQQEQIKAELERAEANLKTQRAASQTTRGALEQHNQTLARLKNEQIPLVAQEARYQNMLHNVTSNRQNITRRLKKIDEEVLLAQQTVTELTAMQNQQEQQREQLQQQQESLKVTLRHVTRQLEETDQALKQQVKTVQTLELERNRLQTRRGELEKLQDNFEWYQGGVKAVMKDYLAASTSASAATPGQEQHGILGLVADVLDVRPGFEAAVEAALGEALQYILVQDQAAARRAIDFLKAKQAGRCGFIPVNTCQALASPSPIEAEALYHKVQVQAPYQNTIARLLAGVILVSDLENQPPAPACASVRLWVTQAGEQLTCQGIRVGGSLSRSGILIQKQEIKTLLRTLAAQQEAIQQAAARQTDLEHRARTLEISLQEYTSSKNQLQQEEISLEKQAYKTAEDLKHAARNFDIIQLEQDQLSGEEADLEAETEKCHANLIQIRDQITQTQTRAEEVQRAIEALMLQSEAAHQEFMTQQMRLTALTAEHDNNRKTRQRLQEFLKDGHQRQEQITADLDQKVPRLAQNRQKMETNEAVLASNYETIKQMETQLTADENESSRIDAELQDSDRQISDIQQQREATSSQVRLLELEISQVQIKLEALMQDLRERYRQPFEELHQESTASELATLDEADLEKHLHLTREKISRLTDVNLGAINEYNELKERFEFIDTQRQDLVKAIADLEEVIRKINRITQERFLETFAAINDKLQEVFPRLFEGGNAWLVLTDPQKPLETGVEFMIQPPGKKLTRLSLLSGGEKALSAIAFIFAIFLMRPAAFCLLDEIDAPLDEANVLRFNNLLKMIGEQSQIIMVTHNKRTMEFADVLLGITMEQKGVSKVVSVNLHQAEAFLEE